MNASRKALTLVGFVIGVGLFAAPSVAAEPAKFQIVAQANTGNVWLLNTETGELRLCLIRPTKEQALTVEEMNDRALEKPYCGRPATISKERPGDVEKVPQ
jgi:hypothetical protein